MRGRQRSPAYRRQDRDRRVIARLFRVTPPPVRPARRARRSRNHLPASASVHLPIGCLARKQASDVPPLISHCPRSDDMQYSCWPERTDFAGRACRRLRAWRRSNQSGCGRAARDRQHHDSFRTKRLRQDARWKQDGFGPLIAKANGKQCSARSIAVQRFQLSRQFGPNAH